MTAVTAARPETALDSAAPAPPAAAEGAASGARFATVWVVSTYFAEGLPYSIVHQVAAQLFTAFGASLSAIGLTSLYGLAWNLKFAWSPFVDRVGTTRRWLLGVEIALAVAIMVLAWPAGRGDLDVVGRGLVLVAMLAATHDIAIDGFYLRALERDSQAALSGVRVTAYRVALLVGNGVLVWIAGVASWFVCFFAAGALLLLLAAAHAFYLPRPAGDVREDDGKSLGRGFLDALKSFLQQGDIGKTIAFLLLFRAGDSMMFAMNKPFLRDLGLDTATQGLVNGIAGTIASVGGSMLGGLWISRRGLSRSLVPIATAQSTAILLYVWLAWARPPLAAIAVVVVAEQLVAGIGTAALLVFIMQRSAGNYKTSHFAFGTALMSVAMTLVGGASGAVATQVGFTAFFAIAFAASIPGVVLSRFVPKST